MKHAAQALCALLCLIGAVTTSPAGFLRIDGALPGGGDCALFGSWDVTSATCTVEDALIPAGDRVDVVAATLLVDGSLTNEGMLVNDGLLIVHGDLNNANDLVNNWTATMVVHGMYFSHFMYNFGRLINEATGFVDFDFFLENNGPLINRGAMRVNASLFTNIPQRRIENLGSIEFTQNVLLLNEGLLLNVGQIDNQGTIDNGAQIIEHCHSQWTGNAPAGDPPTGAQSISMARDALSWCAVSGAADYDVVVGDLDLLRSSTGDFTAATTACLGDAVGGLTADHTGVTISGSGVWFLVRANGVAGAGFDSVFTSQSDARESEIDVSAGGCS